VGVSGKQPFDSAAANGSDEEHFLFDDCRVACTSTRLHLRSRVCFVFSLSPDVSPIVSPSFESLSRPSKRHHAAESPSHTAVVTPAMTTIATPSDGSVAVMSAVGRPIGQCVFVNVRSGLTTYTPEQFDNIFNGVRTALRLDPYLIAHERQVVSRGDGCLTFTTIGIFSDRCTAENAFHKIGAMYAPDLTAGRTILSYERCFW
jgi:hypothetical protein